MPSDPEISLKLEDFLPYRLSVLSNSISGAIAALYAEKFNLSIPEWRVMAVIGRFSGLSAREVTERTAMDKVAVSRAVRKLEQASFLRRALASDDRRRLILALTDHGRDIYRRVAPRAMNYEKALLAGISESDRRTLHTLLDRLSARMEEMAQSDAPFAAGGAAPRPRAGPKA